MILPYDKIQFCNPPFSQNETIIKHSITVGTHLVNGQPTWYRRLNGTLDNNFGCTALFDEGFLVEDKGTNCYLAFTASPVVQKQHFGFNCFWKYRIIPFTENKIGFIVISRNACSCLLATAAKQQNPNGVKDEYKEPALAWWELGHYTDDTLEPYSHYKLAFVYADPFDRWCNTCNYFEGVSANANGDLYLPQSLDKEKFKQDKHAKMYSFLAHCRIESKFNASGKDQHLMGQLETISLCPRMPDIVVPIKLLNKYIREVIGMEPVKANVEDNWWFDPKTDVPGDIKEEVKALYNEDYDIPELFKGKFYEG